MNLSLLRLSLGGLLLAFWVEARATPFSFQYSFEPDSPGVYAPVISGTFDGDLVGALVQNITNINIAIDGAPLAPITNAQFFAAGWNATLGDWTGTPQISFALHSNNFAFSDADLAAGDLSGDFIFYLVPGDPSVGAYGQSLSRGVFEVDGVDALGQWRLSGPSVPDETNTAGILFITLAALALLRCYRRT